MQPEECSKICKRWKRNSEKSRPDIIWILEPDAQEGQSHHYILKLTYSKIDFIFGIQFYKF